MAQIPLVAESPALNASPFTAYVAGMVASFPTALQNNQTTLANRDKTIIAALEKLQLSIGNGVLTGGTITAGTGLSVNVAALTALVGTWVGFDASQVVGGLTNAATNYLFLRQDGTWTVNATGTPPLTTDGHGDFLLWGTATTAGNVVTAVSNVRRTFTQNLAVMPLLTADPASPVTGDIWGRTDTSTIHVQGLGTFSVAGGGGTGNMTNRGTYDNTVTYVVGDVVQLSGSSYVCILSTVGHTPPNATYWNVLAQAGAAGSNGATLNPRGAYAGGTTYALNDSVSYGGSSYVALGATTGNLPTDTTYWQVLASIGPQGVAGAQGYTQRGTYSAGTAYAAYDVVQYNGSSYVAIGATTGNLPTNATYWAVQASKGDPGTGTPGTNGSVPHFGTGVPSAGLGADTDLYFNTATNDLYVKSGGAWTVQANFTGGPGSPGAPGTAVPIRGTFEMYAYGTLATGADPVPRIIPDNWGGTITFDKMHIYLSTTGSSNTSVTIELYHGTGAFSATYTSQTFTLGSGVSELIVSSPTGLTTILPGDKIRARITSAGTGASDLLISPTFLHQ